MTLKERRIRRLKSEIALLEGMDNRVWWKAIKYALVAIPFILWTTYHSLATVWQSHPVIGTFMLATIVFVIWWAVVYAIFYPVIFIFIGFSLLFLINIAALFAGGQGVEVPYFPNLKQQRRSKIAHALEKRRAALARLMRPTAATP